MRPAMCNQDLRMAPSCLSTGWTVSQIMSTFKTDACGAVGSIQLTRQPCTRRLDLRRASMAAHGDQSQCLKRLLSFCGSRTEPWTMSRRASQLQTAGKRRHTYLSAQSTIRKPLQDEMLLSACQLKFLIVSSVLHPCML